MNFIQNDNFNNHSRLILQQAESLMLFKTGWILIGMTVWSLKNIFTLFELNKYACFDDRSLRDRFWIANFYMWTIIGYIAAIITIIALPGVALYNCYRVTDRVITTNPYNITGSVIT